MNQPQHPSNTDNAKAAQSGGSHEQFFDSLISEEPLNYSIERYAHILASHILDTDEDDHEHDESSAPLTKQLTKFLNQVVQAQRLADKQALLAAMPEKRTPDDWTWDDNGYPDRVKIASREEYNKAIEQLTSVIERHYSL